MKCVMKVLLLYDISPVYKYSGIPPALPSERPVLQSNQVRYTCNLVCIAVKQL